jgi:hypothetical protein
MAARHEMVYEHEVESLRIPAGAHTFEGFWRWVDSDAFPGSGRIDFLGGEIEADLKPGGSGLVPAKPVGDYTATISTRSPMARKSSGLRV